MTIYSVNSEILYEAPLTEDALIKYELMGDYYIELPFDAGSYIDIPRGSYIDHEGTRYTVMENILPEPKDEGGYHYAVKFWAGQSFMKNRKLFWLKGANKESSFHITTTIDQFGQLVVDNMNEFMPDKWTLASQFPADALTVTKTISFEGDSCWDAVSSIAEAYGIEWWVRHDYDRMELYFGKLEGGNLVDFKVGEAITSIPSQKGDDSQYGTRFYVYGSNQNLPEGYGDTEQGGTVHHVSNPRLMLPSGIDYIDAKRDMTPAEIIEQVVIFEDVYPKNTDTVTAVTTVQRPIENAAEGQPQTFTAYQLIAANTPFIPSDVMEGETLRLVFNSGALTGVEFEVDLRDADDNHIDPIQWKPEDGFIKKFELIAITEQVGDTVATLPNESVHPVVGDEFVLLGVRLSEDKVREAEEELLQRGEEWKDEHSKDTSVYNCPTNPVYCKRELLSFALGQRVRLYDPRFDGGYRDSRIQGFEKRIWNEYIATYTIGDNAAYTRIGAVESSVTNLKTTERTIGMILDELASTAKDLSDMFEMVEYNKTKMIRANYDFFSVGGVTAGGIGSSGGGTGGGGSSTLAGLNDVALKSAIANDMLVYNGTHWVNTPMSAIKPDLTDYATKSWVEGKGYITESALDPYAKTADVANTYATQTALQGVDIRVQAIEYIFEKDNDGVINKWSEIVDFLAGVEGTTLDGILEQFMPKTGGEFTNAITISKDISAGGRQLILNGTSAEQVNWNAIISFRKVGEELAYIGASAGSDNSRTLNFVVADTSMYLGAGGLNVNGNVTAPTFIGRCEGDRIYLTTALTGMTGATGQMIVLNSTSSANPEDAPGIGFHIPNVGWASMKYTQNGFAFYNNGMTSFVPVYASKFVGALQGNADSATKLQTPRTLWGQSFDGTGNVDGDMTIYDGSITIKGRGGNASTKEILFVSSDYYNGVKVVAEHANYASRKDLVIYTSNNEVAPYEPKWAEAVRVGYQNNVRLAATKIRVSTPAISSLDATNGSANAWNVNYNAMFESNNNALTITVDGTQNVRNAMIQVGHSNGGFASALGDLYINPLGGNVGIGTTNPTAKLHVEGKTLITDSTTIEQNLFVDKNIYIAESSSNGGIYFGDDEYAYIKETPDDVMTIASNQGLILRVNHISDEGAVIKLDGPVRIGDAILSWDSTNKCVTIKNANTGEKASLLVDGGVTATAIN